MLINYWTHLFLLLIHSFLPVMQTPFVGYWLQFAVGRSVEALQPVNKKEMIYTFKSYYFFIYIKFNSLCIFTCPKLSKLYLFTFITAVLATFKMLSFFTCI